jgi:hypothetical protein
MIRKKRFINVRTHIDYRILPPSICRTSRCLVIKMNRIFRLFLSHMEERSVKCSIPTKIHKDSFLVKKVTYFYKCVEHRQYNIFVLYLFCDISIGYRFTIDFPMTIGICCQTLFAHDSQKTPPWLELPLTVGAV